MLQALSVQYQAKKAKDKEGGIGMFRVIFMFMLIDSMVSIAEVMQRFKVRGADGKMHQLTSSIAHDAHDDLASWPASVEHGHRTALALLYNRVRHLHIKHNFGQ